MVGVVLTLRYTILCVDDDPDLLAVEKMFIEDTGEFTVHLQHSAKEALAALGRQRYDAIVSDYQMPQMSGLSLLKEVRSSFGNIPFIIFTGRGREEVAIEALNNGADFYIQKGGDPEAIFAELIHFIRRAIQMREAQATIAEQEQRYHDIQNASDMIQSVTPNGHFLFVNQKWQDTLGYSESEIGSITLFDIIDPESMEHCQAFFPRVLAGEDVGIIDVTFRAKDGRKVHAEGFASCRIVDGKPQYTRGIFKDVTDRKETEQALKESEEKFRTLVEHALDGILILDPRGLILFANHAAGRLVEDEDYRRIIGKQNVLAFIAPPSQDAVIADFAKVAQGIDGFIAQYQVITTQHRTRWVESIGKAITFEKKPAILISLRDISDRMHTESVMRESEEKFRTIFEASPYPIAINSMPDQKFIAVNPSFVKIGGYMEEEIIGKNPVEMGLLSLTEAAKLVSRAVLAGGKVENVPLALTAKEGRRIHVIFSTIPITLGGKPASVTVTAEVTDLKRIEEELIQKNEDLNAAYEELTATEEELRANYEELHNQERALRESEEKFRLLTETTPDVIYMMDREGKITHISPQIARYGYTPEDVLSKNFTAFLEKDDIPRAVADMEKTITTGLSTVTPLQMRDRDGNIRWLEDNGAAFRDVSGRVIGISGILRDITERKEMELALKESEEKFRALVENALEGIFIVNFTGKLLFTNPSAARIVDLDDPRSIVGRLNVMDLVALESKPAVLKDLAQVALGIDAYLVHYHLITAKKRDIWVECIGKKITFEGSTAMLVSMRDVTERHKAELDLRESESRLATLFRSSPVALTLVSAIDGRFVDVNDAFVENTGFGREDAIGKTSAEIHLFADTEDYEQLASALKNHHKVEGMEIRCVAKNGTIQTCRFNSRVIFMKGVPHILSNVENINPQKEAEAALNTLVKSMVGTTGINALHTITENVAAWLGADCVLVSEVTPGRKLLVARSMVLDGSRIASFACSLPGTPCNAVTEQGFLFYGDNLAELFPAAEVVAEHGFKAYIGTPLRDSDRNIIGVLSAFFRTAQQSPAAYREILDIMAVKAAAEIERTRMDQSLRESEEKFRTLVENSLDGIAIVSGNGTILLRNRAAATMVDAPADREVPPDTSVMKYLVPESRDAAVADFANVLGGTNSYPVVYRAFTETGREIWVECLGKKILFGPDPAILVSMRDVTERKRMEDALRRSNKKLSLLSSITRHDVLNKITVIQGFIAITLKKADPAEFSKLIERIGPLIEVIRQQVEFTKAYQDLGTKEPAWQPVGTMIAGLQVPQSVTIRDETQNPEVFADLMLEKVFHNLIDNSLRHGGSVTAIRFGTIRNESGLTITYEDNGCGVPSGDKEKIFERGYGKNTGLGLFLAREILGITGITIQETGTEGGGARFEIRVPENAYRLG